MIKDGLFSCLSNNKTPPLEIFLNVGNLTWRPYLKTLLKEELVRKENQIPKAYLSSHGGLHTATQGELLYSIAGLFVNQREQSWYQR